MKNRPLLARLFCYVGHGADHLFMLLYPTAVLAMGSEFNASYAEMLALATPGFIAFGAGSIPAGWLADRWRATGMLAIFFIGIGAAAIFTAMAHSLWHLGVGLTLIGAFASIYHPVGASVLVANAEKLGKSMGINGMAGTLGTAAGPLAAGLCADAFGWRAAFYLPGAASILLGIAFFLLIKEKHVTAKKNNHRIADDIPRRDLFRVFGFLALAVLCAGIINNTTSVGLPELFQTKLGGSLAGVGTLVAAVYGVAAFAQLIIGHLIDKYPIRTVLAAVQLAQVPFLLLVWQLAAWPLVPVAMVAIFLNLGSIPVSDALIARYSAEKWRSTVYGIKFVLSLGVSALAVPIVSLTHAFTGGDLAPLFLWLAGCAALAGLASLIIPKVPSQQPVTAA